jgi:uncharacterized protein (DUF924 family)
MAVKLLSDTLDATITDDDQIRIDEILTFWFMEKELGAPQIDGRMDIWFGEDSVFDHEVAKEFSDDVDRASEGELDHWSHEPRGRLALILLLDQFRRNIYRNTADAFAKDKAALKLCVEGAMDKTDKGLSPIQLVFFYMPLQHAESRKVHKKSREIYRRLSKTPRRKTGILQAMPRHSGRAIRRRSCCPERGCSYSRLKPLLRVPKE